MAMAVVEVKVILKVELSQCNCQTIVYLALHLKNVMVQQLARIFPIHLILYQKNQSGTELARELTLGSASACLSRVGRRRWEEESEKRKGTREGFVCCLLSG
jgi:hypothetical protein